MTYFPNIDLEEVISFPDPGFDNPGSWNFAHPWSVAGGLGICNQTLNLGNFLAQFGLPIIVGNGYEVTFELSNCNFITPGQGIQCWIDGATDGITYRTNGTHIVRATAIDGTGGVAWLHVPWTIGDFCNIDNVIINPLGTDFYNQTEIDHRPPRAAVIYDLPGGDRIHHVLSYKDKTNCIIKYTP